MKTFKKKTLNGYNDALLMSSLGIQQGLAKSPLAPSNVYHVRCTDTRPNWHYLTEANGNQPIGHKTLVSNSVGVSDMIDIGYIFKIFLINSFGIRSKKYSLLEKYHLYHLFSNSSNIFSQKRLWWPHYKHPMVLCQLPRHQAKYIYYNSKLLAAAVCFSELWPQSCR